MKKQSKKTAKERKRILITDTSKGPKVIIEGFKDGQVIAALEYCKFQILAKYLPEAE